MILFVFLHWTGAKKVTPSILRGLEQFCGTLELLLLLEWRPIIRKNITEGLCSVLVVLLVNSLTLIGSAVR
jgi:hypothetical protein